MKPRVTKARMAIRALAACALVAAGLGALYFLKHSGLIERSLAWMNALGVWAPITFIAIYIATVLTFVPASLMTMGAGILFGLLYGSIYVGIAAYTSSILCFVISRHFGRNWIAARLSKHPQFIALDDAVARDGWKIVVLSRITPGFPFSVVNYGFGLTRIPMWQYALASTAMFPSTAVYVYFGTLIGDVSGLSKGPPLPPWLKLCIAAAAVLMLTYVGRFARRALKAASDKGHPQPGHR